jgi:hypothetical protein
MTLVYQSHVSGSNFSLLTTFQMQPTFIFKLQEALNIGGQNIKYVIYVNKILK